MEKTSHVWCITLFLVATAVVLLWQVSCDMHARCRKYVIGVVDIPVRPLHTYLRDALTDRLKVDGRFELKEFPASSPFFAPSIISACKEALVSDVDLIVCTGRRCTRQFVELLKSIPNKKPIIFWGFDEMEGLNMDLPPEALTHVTALLSGIYVGGNNVAPVDLLLLAKPSIHNVLLPYALFSPASREARAQEIAKSFEERRVKVTLFPVKAVDTCMADIKRALDKHDALMYLEGDALAWRAAELGVLASQRHITFFASSLDGVSHAALSYVAAPYRLIDSTLERIQKILIQKIPAGSLPIESVDVDREFIINTERCESQGLKRLHIRPLLDSVRNSAEFTSLKRHVRVL